MTRQIEQQRVFERLSEVASHSSNLVIVTDADRRIEWVNPAFERRTGHTLDEVRGKHPGPLVQNERTDKATTARIRAALEAGKPAHEEILNQSRDGDEYWLDLNIAPLRDDAGVLTGFMAIQTDITRLKLAEQRLLNVIEGAKVGSWEWTLETGVNTINDRSAEMLGHTRAELEPVMIGTFRSFLHPDHLPPIDKLFEHIFSGETTRFEHEFRMRHKQGHWVWILLRSSVARCP